jgi:hypothetical protein
MFEGVGKSWKELERVGKSWKELEREGREWFVCAREGGCDGEGRWWGAWTHPAKSPSFRNLSALCGVCVCMCVCCVCVLVVVVWGVKIEREKVCE